MWSDSVLYCLVIELCLIFYCKYTFSKSTHPTILFSVWNCFQHRDLHTSWFLISLHQVKNLPLFLESTFVVNVCCQCLLSMFVVNVCCQCLPDYVLSLLLLYCHHVFLIDLQACVIDQKYLFAFFVRISFEQENFKLPSSLPPDFRKVWLFQQISPVWGSHLELLPLLWNHRHRLHKPKTSTNNN